MNRTTTKKLFTFAFMTFCAMLLMASSCEKAEEAVGSAEGTCPR